jgi:RNA polymerase sigma factor (TIGR02999 family)
MNMPASDVTTLLNAAVKGDGRAANEVIARLYDDLHRLAHSRMRRSGDLTLLDTTSLVHEAYLRLERAGELVFADRKHFLGYAAKVMHTIVVDIVRATLAERRGGHAPHVTLDTAIAETVAASDDEVLRVHDALEDLTRMDPRLGQVVEMRYFGGLSEAEIADCLGVTERTIQRDWQKARLLLHVALK